MAKICDNTSVAMLVRNGDSILMVERKKNNFGFALPAGHQDGDSPEVGAARELTEEVGLSVGELSKLFVRDLPNTCGRKGSHHVWSFFEVLKWQGEIKPSPSETKSYLWADGKTVRGLVQKLEAFASEKNIVLVPENLIAFEEATDQDESWRASPGLEPPMYFLFKEAGLI